AGELARAAHFVDVEFAIGAKRIAPLWRILSGVAEGDWVDAIDMDGAQVTVADYCPDWWPANTRLLIRRVRLDVAAGQVSADPRSRRQRTLHPDQHGLPISELADADAVYGYSFTVTNLDVSTPERAAAVEHWYRHRTQVENIFRCAKDTGLDHLPSTSFEINQAWCVAATIACDLLCWLRLLCLDGPLATAEPTTLRYRLLHTAARLVRGQRKRKIKIPEAWPWARELEACLLTVFALVPP
ncbi:MAG: transposase, partial [Pseudonocardiaceae bacterium]